jgi:ribonucleotide reductase alpha subunit
MFQSAVRSCSQGGVRNGAATLYYPLWHLEVEDLLVLKNNTGTEANLIALLMDQVRKLQESNAQRDIKLADALNKKNDDDARERLNFKTATEKDYQAKLEDQKKKYIESYENLSREHHNVLKERLETSTAQALREKEDEADD